MAEGITQERTAKELEREITCGICQEHYSEPKILPCLHYYCRQCVLRLALTTGTCQPFSCPECRCEVTLPKGGVDELKTAFFINRLMTTVLAMKVAYGIVEVKCELCTDSKGNAEAFCRQCTYFICKECVDMHRRVKTFQNHEVSSLEDLKHGRARPFQVKEPPAKKCTVHEKSLKIYCYSCESLICQHCTVKDHRDHDFEFTKKAAPDTRTDLLQELKPLRELHAKWTSAEEQMLTAKTDVQDQGQSTVNIIKSSFKQLHDMLDKREQELLEEVGALVQEKVEKLSAKEKTLSVASAEVQSVADYTEQCVRYYTDDEVISMHAEIINTVRKKREELSKPARTLEPVEEADMGAEVSCGEDLHHLLQTQAVITKLSIDPTKCTVNLKEAPEVDKISGGTVLTKLSNNKPTSKKCEVSCEIKSLHIGVVSDCSIDNDGSGTYSIWYTPTVRGRHELAVSIDGQQVAGSPFPVFVSIHPTRLGKPVKVWAGLSYPFSVTATSAGDVLATEKGRITKLLPNGSTQRLVAQDELKMLRGIAVDDEGRIYCIDEDNSKILTCDKTGDSVQTHEVSQQANLGRRALLITDNELFISEAGYKGTILVYNRELSYIRSIHHDEMGEIKGIATDTCGNLYVTDRTNSCVRVFSSSGDLLHSIGQGSNSLKCPWGVCVCGQYVYVTDTAFHHVAVFTTDGEYVTSFGKYGKIKGLFDGPYYLCVDRDGYIYVCDRRNKRIQCF